MLKLQINKNDSVLNLKELILKNKPSVVKSTNTTDGTIVFETVDPHKLKENDKIQYKNDFIDFSVSEDKYVILTDGNKTKFSTGVFGNYKLYLREVRVDGNDKLTVDNNKLSFFFSQPHDLYFNRGDIKIKRITTEESINDFSGLCSDDYVLVNECLLKQVVSNDNRLSLSTKNFNISGITIKYYNNGEVRSIENCFIPINSDGKDDRYTIICKNVDIDDVEALANSQESITMFKNDERFLKYSNYDELYGHFYSGSTKDEEYKFQYTTKFYEITGNYRLSIPMDQLFATNLYQTELVENDFVGIEKEKAINPIVNMEKYCFSPACINTDGLDDENKEEQLRVPMKFYPIKEINFNLHFRDRRGSDNWSTDDSKYWNSYKSDGENGIMYADKRFWRIDQSDLLGFLNFTNQDVLYQKNKLKKSFIRLSFYDSRDIGTQKLLFYSTIFIDSGTQYGRYCNNIDTSGYTNGGDDLVVGISVDNEYRPYINDNDSNIPVEERKRLSTHLTIKDKYNTDASSEGFYLYLFAEQSSRYIPKKIYMKVEFNHAGYGRTVPFIMPVDDSNKPINPIIIDNNQYKYNTDFPISYKEVDKSNNNFEKINMQRLYKDMFIELGAKYDDEHNTYVWYVPREMDEFNGNKSDSKYSGVLTFNLFEPKIQ